MRTREHPFFPLDLRAKNAPAFLKTGPENKIKEGAAFVAFCQLKRP